MLNLEDPGAKKNKGPKEKQQNEVTAFTPWNPWKSQMGGLYQMKFCVMY